MVQVIYCHSCGSSSLKETSVSLTLTKHRFCNHCSQSKHRTRHLSFCSVDCFTYFAKEIASGKVNNLTID